MVGGQAEQAVLDGDELAGAVGGLADADDLRVGDHLAERPQVPVERRVPGGGGQRVVDACQRQSRVAGRGGTAPRRPGLGRRAEAQHQGQGQ